MNRRVLQHFAGRMTSALLGLALVLGPSLAQVNAAEQCRARCEPARLAGHASCCGEDRVTTDGGSSIDGQAANQSSTGDGDPVTKYCAGCGARPLAVDTPRLTFTLDLIPAFVLAPAATTSSSFDVPFAIFHPPRA